MVPPQYIDLSTGLFNGTPVVPIRFVRMQERAYGRHRLAQLVHAGHEDCGGDLWLDDEGITGELSELIVRCEGCQRTRRVSEAAGKNNPALGQCDGSQEWLGPAAGRDVTCQQTNRFLIRTASNAYFSQKLSVISMPDRGQELHEAVNKVWDSHLHMVQSAGELTFIKRNAMVSSVLAGFADQEVLQVIQGRHSGQAGPPARKIKEAEFELLSFSQARIGKDDAESVFYAEEYPRAHWDGELTRDIERVVVVHRLREVTALVGYTRFDYISPDIDGEFDLNLKPARLAVNANWVPATENKGEEFFLQFGKDAVDRWKNKVAVRDQTRKLELGLYQWCIEQEVGQRDFFGAPYVMLHSLSHLLINAISLECGYPASSIKERIYAKEDQGYGILLYTACSDSHGTLGGLATAAKSIGHYLQLALEMGGLCSNDPICAAQRGGSERAAISPGSGLSWLPAHQRDELRIVQRLPRQEPRGLHGRLRRCGILPTGVMTRRSGCSRPSCNSAMTNSPSFSTRFPRGRSRPVRASSRSERPGLSLALIWSTPGFNGRRTPSRRTPKSSRLWHSSTRIGFARPGSWRSPSLSSPARTSQDPEAVTPESSCERRSNPPQNPCGS